MFVLIRNFLVLQVSGMCVCVSRGLCMYKNDFGLKCIQCKNKYKKKTLFGVRYCCVGVKTEHTEKKRKAKGKFV